MRYCFKARTLAMVGFFSSITKNLEVNVGKITFRVWVLQMEITTREFLAASRRPNIRLTPPPIRGGWSSGSHSNSGSGFLPTQELPTKVPRPAIEKNGQFSTCRVWNWLRTRQGPYLSDIYQETWWNLMGWVFFWWNPS